MSHILVKNQSGFPSHSGLTGLSNDDHPRYAQSGHSHTYSAHSGLGGLLVNDHPQYRLTASTESLTANTLNVDHIDFNISHISEGPVEGRMEWNGDDGTLNLGMPGGNVTLQIGQEELMRVRNITGLDIPNGTLLVVTGASGQRPTVARANAEYSAFSRVCGMATEAIRNGQNGYMNTYGLVRDLVLPSSAYTIGQPLWLSTTGGSFTTVPPSAPKYRVKIGVVVHTGNTDGVILFKPMMPMSSHDLADFNGTQADSTNKYLVWQPEGYYDADVIYHSGLTGIQGGSNGNYYHLGESEYIFTTGSSYSTTDPTGFVNTNHDSTLSFNNANRTLTITPTALTGTFDVMVRGKLFKKSTESIQIPEAEGLTHIVYNENGVLTNLGLTVGIDDFIRNNAYVCHIYWSTGQTGATGVGDERHGTAMDYETHKYLHLTRGAAYLSGFAPFGIDTTVAPASDQAAVVGVEAGVFFDEDLRHDKLRVATGSTIPVIYMSGATGKWRMNPPRIHPIMTGGTGRATYNLNTAGNWTVAEVSNLNYVLYHIFGTNSIDYSVISLMGQAQYSTIALARAGATTEIANLVTNGLPTVEFIPIASIIFHTRDTLYTNQSKSIIVKTDTGENYVDWRTSKISPSSSASDHGSLAGLGDDDHTHYQTSARTETQLTGLTHDIITATKFVAPFSKTLTGTTTTSNTNFSAITSINHTAATRSDSSVSYGFRDVFNYTAGTNSRWTGGHAAFNSEMYLTSNIPQVGTPSKIFAFRSTIDAINAPDLLIDCSPISIEFTNPAVGQAWVDGYFSVTVEGNSDDLPTVAAFTRAKATGTNDAIGYKGYATSLDVNHTGELVGVVGYAFLSSLANNGAVVGVEGVVAGGNSTPKSRQMGMRSNAHALIRGGSLIVSSNGAAASPEDFTGTTGHLDFETSTGQLFVDGVAEFDNEVFFDGNENSSFTAVTGTYTAGTRTIILASNGTYSVFLPAVNGRAGRKYTIKNTGSGTITVDANASETIDGALTQTLTANTVTRLICDGSTWWSI